jgi:ABC1 atypical kinase-like domain
VLVNSNIVLASAPSITTTLCYCCCCTFAAATQLQLQLTQSSTSHHCQQLKQLGQGVSIRPDILPEAYLEELQKLQDQVPPFSSREAQRLLEAQLGCPIEDVFESRAPFERPVAAASLGQVYKAKLREGGVTVAVKVQRPKVRFLQFFSADAGAVVVLCNCAQCIESGQCAAVRSTPAVTTAMRYCYVVIYLCWQSVRTASSAGLLCKGHVASSTRLKTRVFVVVAVVCVSE